MGAEARREAAMEGSEWVIPLATCRVAWGLVRPRSPELGGLQEESGKAPWAVGVWGGGGGRTAGTLEGAMAAVLNLGCRLQRCTGDPSLEVGMGVLSRGEMLGTWRSEVLELGGARWYPALRCTRARGRHRRTSDRPIATGS